MDTTVELLDRDSGPVIDFEATVPGLTEQRDAFEDSANRLTDALSTALPPTRNAVLELLMRHGTDSLWDPLVGSRDILSTANTSVVSGPTATALTAFAAGRSEYRAGRDAVVASDTTPYQLVAGVRACRDNIDQTVIDKLVRQKAVGKLGISVAERRKLDAIEGIALTSSSGYELELMKRHLYQTMQKLHEHGLLADPPEPSHPYYARAQKLQDLYSIDIYFDSSSIDDLPDPEPDEERLNALFAEDIAPDKVFDTYYQAIVDAGSEFLATVHQELLTSNRLQPVLKPTRDEAWEKLKIAGHIPARLKPDALFNFIGHVLPPLALAQPSRLWFRRFTAAEEAWRVDGKLDKTKFIGGLYHRPNRLVEANIKRIETPKRLRHIVIHEIGHAFVEALTLKDVDEFENTRQDEPVHISEYVAYTAKKRPESEASEDWAETFALYYTDQYRLRTLGPARFALMQRIIADYS